VSVDARTAAAREALLLAGLADRARSKGIAIAAEDHAGDLQREPSNRRWVATDTFDALPAHQLLRLAKMLLIVAAVVDEDVVR
jgi:hypothetical protein